MLTEATSQTIEGLWSLVTSQYRRWPVGVQQWYICRLIPRVGQNRHSLN